MLVLLVTLASCDAGGEYPGMEYAPQMYHSVPYEPLTQITSEQLDDQDHFISFYYKTNSLPNSINGLDSGANSNVLYPVQGTIKRQNYKSATLSNETKKDQKLLIYDLPKDSIALAQNLVNPVDSSDAVLRDGKRLYINNCKHCHGAKGQGDGKVADQYNGVADYTSQSNKILSAGHIFHVITHGKGTMWSHKSMTTPEDRWKIVRYVQLLQQGKDIK